MPAELSRILGLGRSWVVGKGGRLVLYIAIKGPKVSIEAISSMGNRRPIRQGECSGKKGPLAADMGAH